MALRLEHAARGRATRQRPRRRPQLPAQSCVRETRGRRAHGRPVTGIDASNAWSLSSSSRSSMLIAPSRAAPAAVLVLVTPSCRPSRRDAEHVGDLRERVAIDRVEEQGRALLTTQLPERGPQHRVMCRLPWLGPRTRPEHQHAIAGDADAPGRPGAGRSCTAMHDRPDRRTGGSAGRRADTSSAPGPSLPRRHRRQGRGGGPGRGIGPRIPVRSRAGWRVQRLSRSALGGCLLHSLQAARSADPCITVRCSNQGLATDTRGG